MIIEKSAGFTLPQQTAPVLSQAPQKGNGELGLFWIPLLAAGGLLLGGGGLWQLHEKREEKSDYLSCVQKYTEPPYSMPPAEAGMVCRGEEVKGFQFGMNAGSFILIAASVFGMWFITSLMINTAKAKLSGRTKGG